MLKDDLRRAGIEYIDSETAEYFDFHSLRVQHATDLAKGGASVAVAQARMRHSDPKLTMNTTPGSARMARQRPWRHYRSDR